MASGGNISFNITLSKPVDLPNVADSASYKLKITNSNGYNKVIVNNMQLSNGTTYTAKVTIPKDVPKNSKVEIVFTANRRTNEFNETVYYPNKKDSNEYAYIGTVTNNVNKDIKFNETN